MRDLFRATAMVAALLGCSVVSVSASAGPATRFGAMSRTAATLIASNSDEDRDETASEAKARAAERRRQLTLKQKRERAALEQRRLLQEKATRARIRTNERNLEALRDDQAERLRLQQQTQRQIMHQQRQLALPQQPGQAPRLTPLDPPLMDQRNPRCGVPGMPLC